MKRIVREKTIDEELEQLNKLPPILSGILIPVGAVVTVLLSVFLSAIIADYTLKLNLGLQFITFSLFVPLSLAFLLAGGVFFGVIAVDIALLFLLAWCLEVLSKNNEKVKFGKVWQNVLSWSEHSVKVMYFHMFSLSVVFGLIRCL